MQSAPETIDALVEHDKQTGMRLHLLRPGFLKVSDKAKRIFKVNILEAIFAS